MKNVYSSSARNIVLTVLAAAGLVAGCAESGNGPPLDVGNMALPTSSLEAAKTTFPLSRSSSFDTGNMAYPEPLSQGVVNRTASPVRYPDTGNMAFPDPRPQGELASKKQ